MTGPPTNPFGYGPAVGLGSLPTLASSNEPKVPVQQNESAVAGFFCKSFFCAIVIVTEPLDTPFVGLPAFEQKIESPSLVHCAHDEMRKTSNGLEVLSGRASARQRADTSTAQRSAAPHARLICERNALASDATARAISYVEKCGLHLENY